MVRGTGPQVWHCTGCKNQAFQVQGPSTSGNSIPAKFPENSDVTWYPKDPPIPMPPYPPEPGQAPVMPDPTICPVPFYPPLEDTCLKGGLCLACGQMTLRMAQQWCSQWNGVAVRIGPFKLGTQCAGFWYDNKVASVQGLPLEYPIYNVYLNSQFNVIPKSRGGECNRCMFQGAPLCPEKMEGTMEAQPMLIPPPVDPRAWQIGFNYMEKHVNNVPSQDVDSGSVDDAGYRCLGDSTCLSYTYPCPNNQCSCTSAKPSCDSKFPKQAKFTFSDRGERYLRSDGAHNAWVKIPQKKSSVTLV